MGCVAAKPPTQPAAPAAEGGTLLGASAEGGGAAVKAVVICNEAVRSKEAADQQRGAAELEGVRRKAQRRSTPFVRPGDAEAFDEDSEGSQAPATSDTDKHATISPEAVRALEQAEQSRDAEEETQARRSRQRKSTPFCGGGAALALPDDEDEDEDTEEEADANADSFLTAVPLVHTDEDPILAATGKAAEAPWFRFWCAGCAHTDAAEQRL